MTTQQPEALRLAEWFEKLTVTDAQVIGCMCAASELRRLHEVNQELLEALRQIIEQHGQWNNGIWAANLAHAAINKSEAA